MANKKLILLFVIGLFFTNNIFSTFTLSGSTVIQTGTNDNLQGIENVAGVTSYNFNGMRVYYTNSLKLEVDGTLTINPEEEQLVFGSSAPLTNIIIDGTLNVGKEITYGGKNRLTTGTAIITDRYGNCCSSGSILIRNGGTLDVKGATLILGGSLISNSGSIFKNNNAIFIEKYQNRDTRLRFQTGTIFDVDGLEAKGMWINIFNSPEKFEGYSPILASGPEYQISEFTIKDYDGTSSIDGFYNEEDGNSYNSAKINLINSKTGSDLSLRVATEQSGNRGVFEISKK